MDRFPIIRALAVAALLLAAAGSLLPQTPSAKDIVIRFCLLDEQGEQLTSEGWQTVAALFAKPGTRRYKKIIVVRDFVVSPPRMDNGRAEFYAEYVQIGEIDIQEMRFSTPAPPGIKVRAGLYTVRQPGGNWMIEGPVPMPHVNVATAIRFVTQLRTQAEDAATRRNADRTLAALKRFR